MDLMAFITHMKDEPLALMVGALFVGYKIIENAVKFAPQLFSKNKKMPTNKWQSFVSDETAEIKEGLKELSKKVEEQGYLLDKTSEGTLENILFDDKRTPFLRLKSFRRLLAMGKNGRVFKRGFDLILQNKETWLDVLDVELGINITDEKYYEEKLNYINTQIFEGFMK